VASRIHGSRRVRFIQSPPTAELLTILAGYVDAKSVTPVIDSVYPWTTSPPPTAPADNRRIRQARHPDHLSLPFNLVVRAVP
jgi:hypothetical protein